VFYNKCIGKYLCDAFRIYCCVKHGDVLSPLLLNFAVQYTNEAPPSREKEEEYRNCRRYWEGKSMQN